MILIPEIYILLKIALLKYRCDSPIVHSHRSGSFCSQSEAFEAFFLKKPGYF